MPLEDDSPAGTSSSNPSIWFFSTVVTDIATGDIIQEESYEYFKLNHGKGFQNDPDDLWYHHSIEVWMILPTFFTMAEANQYSVSEIQTFLSDRQDLNIIYNEQIDIADYSENDSSKNTLIGYTAKGTHVFEVPEPSTLAIFALAMLGFVSRRAVL